MFLFILIVLLDRRLRKICDNEYLNMKSYESVKLWMGPYLGDKESKEKIQTYSDLTDVNIKYLQ